MTKTADGRVEKDAFHELIQKKNELNAKLI